MRKEVLIFDPAVDDDENADHITQFLRFLEEHFPRWNIRRLPYYNHGVTDSAKWFGEMAELVSSSEIFIGLGNWLAIYQLGGKGEVFAILEKKLAEGCPLVGQVTGAATHTPGVHFQKWLKRTQEFQFTDLRVFSPFDTETFEKSERTVYFSKGDDCLAGSMWRGIDKVLIGSPNIVAYQGEASPFVMAKSFDEGGFHLFTDARSDFLTTYQFGQRPAVAVVSQRAEKQLTYWFNGNVLTNFPSLAPQPCMDVNQEFILRLLQSFDDETPRQKMFSNGFKFLYEIESTLGRVSKRIVVAMHGTESEILTYLTEERRSRIQKVFWSALYLSDLNRVLTQEKAILECAVFGSGKNRLDKRISSFNSRHRGYIAHPIRSEEEGYSFSADDLETMEDISQRLIHLEKQLPELLD